ncbi:iron-sulfur cluster loop [Brachyspira aalborgi]|uniref:Iron-sulfur cluster loop n=1 Tax=Brachyspira aalborgi TaxID=29522 RepID=A0A5C8FC72_9SPIR|nr:iron-sulfur cluster loop [Brachyspira aalborgi]TXJ46701.1 iron-sulfur cluster loop [Brachyspira aalborgi]
MDKIKLLLIEKSKKLFEEDKAIVHLVNDEKQNKFLNDLENYPHAFVLACLMDKKIKAERAWAIPYKIYKELKSFDIYKLKEKGKGYYKDLFNKNKFHIFNNDMAEVFYNGICRIIDKYEGKANKIWNDNPSSATVVYRFLEFDGCGIKIATMAANILARQFKIPMKDYYSIDISPDVHIRRVLYRLGFIEKNAKVERVIYKARELNPEYPGLIDYLCWEIGKNYCKPKFKDCKCENCFMNEVCPKNE